MVDISIVIPAYNEENNIGPLLKTLTTYIKQQRWKAEIIVVNDHSTDRTKEIVQKLSKQFSHIVLLNRAKGRNGMGHALIDGTNTAKGKYVIWTMADRSDNISTMEQMIKNLKDGKDLVFGSRYMKQGSSGDLELTKAFCSGGYTFVARFLFGFRVHDITNAFRAFRKDIIQDLHLASGDFAISPEFAIKAHLAGKRLGEVPTTYINRREGQTKFKMLRMGLRYATLFKYRFVKF